MAEMTCFRAIIERVFDLKRRPKLMVFLSSTYVDLYDERERVEAELEGCGLHVVNKLKDIPRDLAHPNQWCAYQVEQADIFVQLIGSRSGSLPYGGMSWLYPEPIIVNELRAANRARKPIIVYHLQVPFADHNPSDESVAFNASCHVDSKEYYTVPITELAVRGVFREWTEILSFKDLERIATDVKRLVGRAWLRRLRFWQYDATKRRYEGYDIDFNERRKVEPVDSARLEAALEEMRSWGDRKGEQRKNGTEGDTKSGNQRE